MYNKTIGIIVCLLFLITTVSLTEATKLNDDVDVNIYASFFGNDIGFGITVEIMNNKSENVTVFVNLSFDYLLRNHWDYTHDYNFTAPPKIRSGSRINTGMKGIKLISITAEAEDKTISRQGIAISKLMIFTD